MKIKVSEEEYLSFSLYAVIYLKSYLIGGNKYFLKQHGFARDLPWSIDLLKDKLGIRLKLVDTKDSRSCFPFLFYSFDGCLLERKKSSNIR